MSFQTRTASLLPAVLLSVTVTASGQIPATFTNLQVLPEDIGRGELIGVMRAFTGALGVRCLHCHVGSDGNTFSDVVFADDDYETKRLARVMLGMVSQINATLISESGRDLTELTEVTCFTCHHGSTQPRTIEEELDTAYREGGAPELLRRYAELREEFYGRAIYDFKNSVLVNQAIALAEAQDDPDGALQLLARNQKLYPKYSYTYFITGQIHLDAGNKKQAVRSLRKALRMEPENSWYEQALKAAQEG